MARESFEDVLVAEVLNEGFISVKVDREERPDIDGVYMRACQAMTGGGGWPASIFMSAGGEPFFAGTYFSRKDFLNLLNAVMRAWRENKPALLRSGSSLTAAIAPARRDTGQARAAPVDEAVKLFRRRFDARFGGFGPPPKFPSPHNLMLLLYTAPELAEKTLEQMYRGGIFDHVGGGFARYSTDRSWLVPHFEKMLYDNALLAMAYSLAYELTGKELYRRVTYRIFEYLERDLSAPGGGFYSAQDADSEGAEGRFYVFTPWEIEKALGKTEGARFCGCYDITPGGNYEGASIPNLIKAPSLEDGCDKLLPKVFEYRKGRVPPDTDKKCLTAWNALVCAAFAMAGRIFGDVKKLAAARKTAGFIERELASGGTLFVSVTDGRRSGPGFLDDYAFFIFALIQLHQATMEARHLERARELAAKVWDSFWDAENGGFFFSGADNERLVSRVKESLDGAMPSGNSVMAYNLSRLEMLTEDERFAEMAARQRRFMNAEAAEYPAGCGFYLYSALPAKKIVCAAAQDNKAFPTIRSNWAFRIEKSTKYPVMNGKTSFYVCENGTCRPPVNEL